MSMLCVYACVRACMCIFVNVCVYGVRVCMRACVHVTHRDSSVVVPSPGGPSELSPWCDCNVKQNKHTFLQITISNHWDC